MVVVVVVVGRRSMSHVSREHVPTEATGRRCP